MAGSDVEDADRHACGPQLHEGIKQGLYHIVLAAADAPPPSGVDIAAVHQAANRCGAASLVPIHVIESAAGIETGFEPQPYSAGEQAPNSHAELKQSIAKSL